MISFKNTVVLATFILASATLFGQKKVVETSFWVGGVCGMCEERIESTLDVKGIQFADYDLANHTLKIVYKSKKISEDQIHKMLNDVGHDTSKAMASDEAYNNVHHCCKYREHEHNH